MKRSLPISYDEIVACEILNSHIGNSNLSTYIKQVAEDSNYVKYVWEDKNEFGYLFSDELEILKKIELQQYLYHIGIISMVELSQEVVREREIRSKAENWEVIFFGEEIPGNINPEYVKLLERSKTGGYNKDLLRAITFQTQGILSSCRDYARYCTDEEAALFLTKYWFQYVPEVNKFYSN